MAKPPSPEAALERELFNTIKRVGGQALKLAPTLAGMPDRLVLLPGGGMYLVELKTEKGKLSDIQRFQHERLKKLGTTVHVLYGPDQVRQWVQWALNDLFEFNLDETERRDRRRRRILRELQAENAGRL